MVYKHDPLDFHKRSRAASEAAEAVRQLKGDTAFWDFTHEAFQQLPGPGGATYPEVLASLRMDRRRVERLMKGGKPGKKIDADIALAEKLGVKGTPHSFVNGVALGGAQPFAKFVDAIDNQLAAARSSSNRACRPRISTSR